MSSSLLSIQNLRIAFENYDILTPVVHQLCLSIAPNETLGIVGESGSGKSQTVLSVMGLLAKNARTKGSILFDQQELLSLTEKRLNKIRGDQIAMIFQDPMTALNPYLKIERQMSEILMIHRAMTRRAAIKESLQLLDAVKIADAKRRIKMYPHEFSGGMRQRVMIAMALLCRPRLLIADEPTTALDVTTQAEILQLLRELKQEFNTAIILITHDLGVVAGLCDNVMVMYGGRMMEYGSAEDIFYSPTHPYTISLLKALPRLDGHHGRLAVVDGQAAAAEKEPASCPFHLACQQKENRHQEVSSEESAPLTPLNRS